VAVDLISYAVFLPFVWPSVAKAASFVSATCVSYTLNKYWTFRATAHSWAQVSKFVTLYGCSLFGNVLVNKVVLESVPRFFPFFSAYTFQLAWLTATGFSTTANYLGQKYWVFKGVSQQNDTAERP
jgi:putative flippase GtrA